MKVALLTTSFSPFADSQTIRTLYLTRALQAPEWRWDFVVPGAVGAPPVDDVAALVPTGARVLRTRPVLAERLSGALSRLPLRRWTQPVATNVLYRVGVPDAQVGWNRLAVRTAEAAFRAAPPDVLVSSSGSATAHLAAATLSRRHGIPWIADYGDPWHLTDRVARPWVAPFSARLERETLATASRLLFTTEETLAAYRDWLGAALPPAEVLPYGFVADEFDDDAEPPAFGADRPVVVAHVGAAYVANRNLLPLIRAAGALRGRSGTVAPMARLRIVGNQSRAFREEAVALGLADAEFVGRVGYAAAIAWIRSSDVLVVVGNSSPLQIPGKVFPALGSAKPILYIGQMAAEDDPTWRLLRRFAGVVHAPNDTAALTRRLADILESIDSLTDAAAGRRHDRGLAEFEATSISRRFGAMLQQAAGGAARFSGSAGDRVAAMAR